MGNYAGLTTFAKQLWDKELIIEAIEQMWLKKFMSQRGRSPILLKTEFQKDKGYRMTVGLTMKLDGEGVDGDNELEGNEEDLDEYSMTFDINQKRNAVRLKGRMDEQKTAYNMRSTAKEVIGIWLAEIMEKESFRKMGGLTTYTFSNTPTAPSTNRILYGGDATADSDIETADKLTLALIHKAVVKALTVTPKLQPIRYEGRDYYVLVIHPNQSYDLHQDPGYTALMRDAEIRGKTNPLISGAEAVVACAGATVIIHVHNYIPTFSTWGAGGEEPGARALLLGQKALAIGLASAGPGWNERDFDYGNKWAIAAGRIMGFQKSVFNSEDFGVISIDTYATSL